MKRWSILVMVGLAAMASEAAAQDAPLKKTNKTATRPAPAKTAPAARAPQAPRAAHALASQPAAPSAPADPMIESARARADIAAKEATCLREAAHSVQAATQRLGAAKSAEEIATRREELKFAVGVLEECRNIAQKRLTAAPTGPEPVAAAAAEPEPSPSPAAPAPTASDASRTSFSFGAIRVEDGSIDPMSLVSALRNTAPRLTQCYESERAHTPGLTGSVQLRMRFNKRADNARPTAVVIPDSSLANEAVHRCLARTLMSTSFGRTAPGSQVSLRLGFARER